MNRTHPARHVRPALFALATFAALIAIIIGFTGGNSRTALAQAQGSPSPATNTATSTAPATNTASASTTATSASEDANGTVTFKLTPLNDSGVSGVATIKIEDDTFSVTVNATGVVPGIMHAMHIHTGSSCPTMASDTNGDGYVDVIEGVPAYGPILIPFDDDLSSQADGTFPTASDSGVITYSSSTSLSKMLDDLHATDPNTADAVAKLKPQEALNVMARTVVIHGVASDTSLPASVQTLGDLPAAAVVPVACGTAEAAAAPGGSATSTATATGSASATGTAAATNTPAATMTTSGSSAASGTQTAVAGMSAPSTGSGVAASSDSPVMLWVILGIIAIAAGGVVTATTVRARH